MTQISTHNPVRSDIPFPAPQAETSPAAARRGWAVAGVGAALTALGGTIASYGVDAVYDPELEGDAPAILAALQEKVPQMTVFHVLSSVAALLLGVFAVGLHRRLRQRLPQDSLLPALAAFGLLGTAVVLVLAGALDTEFIAGVRQPETVVPATAAMYNQWLGTVPGCWILAGISGVAMFAASRQGAVPRWLGVTGLVLGGLTMLTGASPMQYLAVATGVLWLLVTSAGFVLGDRAHRG